MVTPGLFQLKMRSGPQAAVGHCHTVCRFDGTLALYCLLHHVLQRTDDGISLAISPYVSGFRSAADITYYSL